MGGAERSLLGKALGHYCIIDRLGRGGYGDVYLAIDDKLKRRVALKVLRRRRGAGAEARGRLLREARLLSRLEHRNICRIYEILQEDESDVLVLEFIEGKSLRKKAKEEGLGRSQRFDVSLQITEALIRAHDEGIVHRDLKPDNVLIGPSGEAKVLDFGLAREKAQEMQTVTLSSGQADAEDGDEVFTAAGSVLGTLVYMSPEQARGESVTAASDIYSLGLVMQEIFTGLPPFDPMSGAAERLRRSREGIKEPIRGLDGDLTRLLERMTSLSPSARPAAADISERLRWIRSKPARRSRRMLAAAGAALLVLFAALSAVQAVRVWKERVRADEAAAKARNEELRAREVTRFMVELFEVPEEDRGFGEEITARQILDRGAVKIRGRLEGQPLLRARLQETVGVVYRSLGLYEEARPHLEQAFETHRERLGESHLATAQSATSLGNLDMEQDRFIEAERLFKMALEAREAELGPDHPEVARCLNNLGSLAKDRGKYDEAEAFFSRSMAIKARVLGPNDPSLANGLYNLAVLQKRQGKPEEAERNYRRAMNIQKMSLDPDDPARGYAMNGLALFWAGQGKYQEAETLFLEVLDLWEHALGPDHPRVGTVLTNLGGLYEKQERWDEAVRCLTRSLEIKERALGRDHASIAYALNTLAGIYWGRDDLRSADRQYRRALEIRERALGPMHPETAFTCYCLAELCAERNRTGEAVALYRRSIAVWEDTLGEKHIHVGYALYGLGSLEARRGRETEARAHLERALSVFEEALGPEDPATADVRSKLAGLG